MKNQYAFDTEHLRIRTIIEEDADQLVAWRSDSAIIRYFYYAKPLTREQHLSWYHNSYELTDSRYDFVMSIGGEQIGFLSLTEIDYENRTCEVGYAIGNATYQGRGYAKEATKGLIEFAQREFGMKEFFAGIHRENKASIQMIQTMGFEFIATQDQYHQYRYKC